MFPWNFLIKKMYRKDLSISLSIYEVGFAIELVYRQLNWDDVIPDKS